MKHPDQNPSLPTWIFIVTDLALIGAAILIACKARQPYSESTTLWIVICVIIGAIAGLVPIIAHYERVKNETLDDRQRALEALSRTITSSAEQISIAANGLHEIAELSLKNLRHAEQLPQKLQEKIAEFQAALVHTQDADKAALEKELVALRTTESERLESISDKISRSTEDWAKLEATTQKNLSAAQEVVARSTTDALEKLSTSTTAAVALAATEAAASIALAGEKAGLAITSASASAEQTLAQAHGRTTDHVAAKIALLSQTVAAASAAADENMARAHQRTTADLDEKITTVGRAIATATADAIAALEQKIAALEAAAKAALAPVYVSAPPTTIVTDPTSLEAPAAPPNETTVKPENSPAASEATAHPPRRPRKPRREPAASEDPPAPPPPVSVATPADEPPPVPAESIAKVSHIAPGTTEPFVATITETPAAEPNQEPTPAPVASVPAPNVNITPLHEIPPATPTAAETTPPSALAAPDPVVEDSPVSETPAAASVEPSPEPVSEITPMVEAPVAAILVEESNEVLTTPESATTEPAIADATPEPDAPAPVSEPIEDESPKSSRKRTAKKSEPDEESEPALGLDLDDTPPPQSVELAERTLTSDGATRLIVTAYIGIGNRLFIRGEGPGLSWEKGVPLQFISIGRWRWETSDAMAPVNFKLYKNDSVECTALGAQILDAGHQQELTASF